MSMGRTNGSLDWTRSGSKSSGPKSRSCSTDGWRRYMTLATARPYLEGRAVFVGRW